MAGDNLNIGKNNEVLVKIEKNDICLLNLDEARVLKPMEVHVNLDLKITQTQERIGALVEKLAALHPDGYEGALNSMVKGPAHDYARSLIKPNPTVIG